MADSILYGKSDNSTLRSYAAADILKYVNLFERVDIDVSFFGDNIYNLLANATFEDADIEKTFIYDPTKNAFIRRINYGEDAINIDDFRFAVLSLILNANKKMQEDDFEELFIDGEETINSNNNLGLEFDINDKTYKMVNKKVCERIAEIALGNPDDKVVTIETYEDEIFRNLEQLVGGEKLISHFINNNGQAFYSDVLALFNGNKVGCKRFFDILEKFETIDRNDVREYNKLCRDYHDLEQGLERIAAINKNSQFKAKQAI